MASWGGEGQESEVWNLQLQDLMRNLQFTSRNRKQEQEQEQEQESMASDRQGNPSVFTSSLSSSCVRKAVPLWGSEVLLLGPGWTRSAPPPPWKR